MGGMTAAWWVTADVREALAATPDGSVDLVLSSPPFWRQRSYLADDDPLKVFEIGQEPTPAAWLTTQLQLADEFARVLAPHGSLCYEVGDKYSGSGGAGGDYDDGGLRDGQNRFGAHRPGESDPLDKSLCFTPQLFGASLAYGRNLLTGEACRQWRVRNVVAWVRPNPPVGALSDKFRPATSYITVACQSRARWFDLDAVRGDRSPNTHARTAKGVESKPRSGKSADRDGNWDSLPELAETAGAPPLDWWCIPPGGYEGAHYAVWPPELLVRPIKAMCPTRVCTVCGEPSRRIMEADAEYAKHLGKSWADKDEKRTKAAKGERSNHSGQPVGAHITSAQRNTVGWSDCGHGSFRNGRVLDPFGGSGTTAMVATGHGRDCVSFDLDSRNADLAYERVGGLVFREVGLGDLAGVLGATTEAAA